MKKAKLMLAGLALFATVGTALAFKAQTFNGDLFCTSIKGDECATSPKFIEASNGTTFLYCSTNSANCDLETETKKVRQDAR